MIQALLLSALLEARVLRVCADCESSTVKAALKAARPFDTIEVSEGTYREGRIDIEKPLRLVGIGRPVLDGNGEGHVVLIASPDVTLEGFAIQNSGNSDIQEFAGVYAEKADRCRIAGNTLTANTYGIYISSTNHCVIQGNAVAGSHTQEITAGNGIHLYQASDIEVYENQVSRHRDGIYFEFAERLRVKKNHVHHNLRYGMHFMFSHENLFEENLFQDNPTGCALMYSRGLKVYRNLFEKSLGFAAYGLLLKDIESSELTGNTFTGNTVAVYMEGASRNTFELNRIKKNGWAVRILGSADSNTFKRNAFEDNVFDVGTNSRESLNDFDGNFWSAYAGYDLDRNGVGDVPYRPVAIFGYWVNQYAVLIMLLGAPVLEFLEVAERVLPVITPVDLKDNAPLLRSPSV